jgi:hypothetical protein
MKMSNKTRIVLGMAMIVIAAIQIIFVWGTETVPLIRYIIAQMTIMVLALGYCFGGGK